jgi:hypothetical protein
MYFAAIEAGLKGLVSKYDIRLSAVETLKKNPLGFYRGESALDFYRTNTDPLIRPYGSAWSA